MSDETYTCTGCAGEVTIDDAIWLPERDGPAKPFCSRECFATSRRAKVQENDKPPRDGRACFYAMVLPRAIAAARGCGYALGLHGSLVNDCDLIAVPWVADAKSDLELVDAVARAVLGLVPGTWIGGEPGLGAWIIRPEETKQPPKPHGRRVWNICYGGRTLIDLSVMPRQAVPA